MKKELNIKSLFKITFLLSALLGSMPGNTAEHPPEGALMRTMFGDDIEDKLWGVRISGLLMAGYVHNFRDNPTLCLKNDVLLAFPPSDLEVLSWQDVTRFPIRVGH